MKEDITDPIVIYYDNTTAINISKNHVMHTKTNIIEIKYHYLRELVEDKEVRLEYVNTKEEITEIFTKEQPKETHEYLREKLWVIALFEDQ